MTAENENENETIAENKIIDIVARQHDYFKSGATKNYPFRIENLKKLKSALIKNETVIHAALKQDLGKPEFESYLSETGFSLDDLSTTIRHLSKWIKPKKTITPLLIQPGSSYIYYSPLGVNLIISPYNYPINLTISPLIAAIAAGNTAVLKTSEMTPYCSNVIGNLIRDNFAPEYIAYVEGEVKETTILLQQKFDHIFFTGSPRVGSIVMSAAAKNLTPVTLELGGKSPCIVHEDAKLNIAVNRIVFGKYLNAGQTCIAPDFVIVHKSIKDKFISKLKARIIKVYGQDPLSSPDLARIVNDNHFQRVCGLIDQEKVLVGGQSEALSRFIAPTAMINVTLADKVMSEEIFGPILPILEYNDLNEVYKIVDQLPHHPLASYLFSENTKIQQEIINNIQSGGTCINNCVFHVGNHYLPFGGVGNSGIGAYHGFHGFECFSHKKAVLKTATWVDIPLVYAPYRKKLRLLRNILN